MVVSLTVARIRALTKKPTKLQAIANNLLGDVVAVMDKQLDEAIKTLQTEPPPKAGSSYIRTHNYSRHWERTDVRLTGSGLVATISNDERYAIFVGGDEAGRGQQPQHSVTGWPLMAVALREGRVGGATFASKLRKALKQTVDEA